MDLRLSQLPFSGRHIMHRTEVISEVTREVEAENTVRKTYVKQDMVEISLNLTGKAMRVAIPPHLKRIHVTVVLRPNIYYIFIYLREYLSSRYF